MEGLSFQIETIRTPYESMLLGSQVYHLKAQPTCVLCQPTCVLFVCLNRLPDGLLESS